MLRVFPVTQGVLGRRMTGLPISRPEGMEPSMIVCFLVAAGQGDLIQKQLQVHLIVTNRP